MKVLIVDDEPLARDELSYLLKQNDLIDEINEADGINSAREEIENNRPDLIFLDIQLDDGSGMAFAKGLKKKENCPYIVFGTAYDQYALDAFEADAIDYVLKPFEADRINDAVRRVARLMDNQNGSRGVTTQQRNPRISLTNDERTIVIQKRNILYIQAQAGKAVVHTEDQEVVSKQTLNSIINLLDPNRFTRVHRSFVVNLNTVHELQPSFNHTYELTLDDGSKIPVSRSFVASTKKALGV